MGLNLFGSNYLQVRNEHLLPLVNYGIPKDKTEHWSFKDILTTNIISLNKLSGQAVELEISKSDFYKALHCDIELFINKTYIQYSDFIKSSANSPCWSFVTLYYFTFFASTCFLRFLRRGFIFLSKEQAKRIEDFSLAVYSNPINLGAGNFYFSYKEENSLGNVVITLTSKGESVHKLNWYQLESVFRSFIPNCDDDEKAIFNMFLSLFSKFKTEYPSNARNKLNYNGVSSLLDLDNAIPYVDLIKVNNTFSKGLFLLDTRVTTNNQINSTSYLGYFLLKYCNELYGEYLSRSAFGQDFNAKRTRYLRNKNVASFI